MSTERRVVTRFAPSPTGTLHIGSARTTLMNVLYARKHNGTFLLRIEDTDTARSKPEFEKNIFDSLAWLGIQSDSEILRQSERGEVYKKYLSKLIEEGKAYISKEDLSDEEEQSDKRREVIRFKNPNVVITFEDIVRGTVSVDTTDLSDFVIARSLSEPLYHLAVVIDDYESKVTHVIRAAEHLSNTPRQILLQQAIDAPQPTYAHIPVVLGKDGKKKLSKRDGAASVMDFKDAGYLPEAIINYLALIGWHPSESDKEIFSFDELVSEFELEKVQKAGGQFDIEKLKWVNREHILKLSDLEMMEHSKKWLPQSLTTLPEWSEERLTRSIPLIRERISTFLDIRTMAEQGEWDFLGIAPTLDSKVIVWKKSSKEETVKHLQQILIVIKDVPELANSQEYENVIMPYADENGRGEVLWPLRYSLSGKERSPGPFEIAGILGASAVRSRIQNAIDQLTNDHAQ